MMKIQLQDFDKVLVNEEINFNKYYCAVQSCGSCDYEINHKSQLNR